MKLSVKRPVGDTVDEELKVITFSLKAIFGLPLGEYCEIAGNQEPKVIDMKSGLSTIAELSFIQFKQAALQGVIHQATGIPYEEEQYAKTPITMGYINGYSEEDICHFYAFKTTYPRLCFDMERNDILRRLQFNKVGKQRQ